MTRLSRSEVLAIRRQFDAGHTITELAGAYRRSWRAMADVAHRKTYLHVIDVGDVPPLPNAPTEPETTVGRMRQATGR